MQINKLSILNNKEVLIILDTINHSIYWKDCDGNYLGGNRYFLKILGLASRSELVGKSDNDFFSAKDAAQIRKNDLSAVENSYSNSEESLQINGKLEYYLASKNSLMDNNNHIIGVFGISVCITELKHQMVEEEVKTSQIIDRIPANIYWKHQNGYYLGCNKSQKERTGFDIAGKTEYDLWPKEEADKIRQIDQKVLENGFYSGEEIVTDNIDKTVKYYLSSKHRLYNSNHEVVGIIGVSIDISAQKEAEQLRIEEQEKFRKIAAQVAHDIGSPLASLRMIIPHCHTLPENTRNALNKAATRISDIAENFLSQFKPRDDEGFNHFRIPTLVMEEILEILTEKKYQYNGLPIDFITNISPNGAFSFIHIETKAFKRMLSNLINNAVDALEGKMGEIVVSLDEIDNQVLIIIADNGKGMSEEVKNKILANIEVSSDKADGHGIGFMQIRETLHDNEGEFSIDSQPGIGTKISILFPKVNTPNWMTNSIELNGDDQVIILDDDDSIHSAWELRFEKSAPHIKRYHFKQGHEAIEFINNIPIEDKNKVFLLTDYELLKQGLHGLDVIEKTGLKRSILVTSHHNNPLIRDKAMFTNTKILPKLLASNVAINCI